MRKQSLRIFFGVTFLVLLVVASAGANSGINMQGARSFDFTVGDEEVLASISQRRVGAHALFFCNAGSGEGAIARLDSAGNYSFVGALSGFARGWSRIIGVNTGGPLFYNASTRRDATARIDSTGNYTFVVNISGFSTSWTPIVGL